MVSGGLFFDEIFALLCYNLCENLGTPGVGFT